MSQIANFDNKDEQRRALPTVVYQPTSLIENIFYEVIVPVFKEGIEAARSLDQAVLSAHFTYAVLDGLRYNIGWARLTSNSYFAQVGVGKGALIHEGDDTLTISDVDLGEFIEDETVELGGESNSDPTSLSVGFGVHFLHYEFGFSDANISLGYFAQVGTIVNLNSESLSEITTGLDVTGYLFGGIGMELSANLFSLLRITSGGQLNTAFDVTGGYNERFFSFSLGTGINFD